MGKRLGLVLASGSLLVLLTAGQGPPGDTSPESIGSVNRCTPQDVHRLVQRFTDAFNRGDLAELDKLVSEQQFVWYATNAPGQRINAEADDRSTLIAYFAARHRQHERLLLKAVNVTYTDASSGGFWFRLTRSADDGLPPTDYNGKGEIQCATVPSSLTGWAMSPLPWWPPYDLLPEAVALILIAGAIGGVFLWRRRRTPRPGSSLG